MPRLVQAVFDQVQMTLCDEEGVHWTPDELLMYFNEALSEIAGLRPDAFVKQITLELKPGKYQQLPKPFIDIVEVQGNLDENGKQVAGSINKTTSTAGDRLGGKYNCAPDGIAARYDGVKGYKITAASHGYYTVNPPVPEGEEVRITAMVYVPPPLFTEEHMQDCNCVLPTIYDAQIVDWMLKRAYEKDIESQWARDRAAYYGAQFSIGMNGDYRAASRLRSGYILGEKGTGVETTGWRNEIRGVIGNG